MPMRLKYLEGEYDQQSTRRTGTPRGSETIIAPTSGPKTLQGPGDLAPPFEGGGRQADLPADYDQRAAADIDWQRQLARNVRQDREAVGVPRSLSGTPWVRGERY
jgi:hypothetical protein